MTTEQQQNASQMREAWKKWHDSKGSDLAMWKDYMSDDIKLFSLADGDDKLPFTTKRQGYNEIHRYLEGLTDAFSMGHWRIDETVAEGDRVIGIGSTGWTHKISGKSFVTPVVIVTRWRDGKMCEYGEYYDTAKAAASTH